MKEDAAPYAMREYVHILRRRSRYQTTKKLFK